ncbi:MAG: uL22 family ribosomal protein [Patescibacteria group bacterium]
MKAFLSNYRQSPRKTRLVTELVKGKTVPQALTALKFLEKRAAAPIAKLIASAAANAHNSRMLC